MSAAQKSFHASLVSPCQQQNWGQQSAGFLRRRCTPQIEHRATEQFADAPSTAVCAMQSCGACRRMLARFEAMSREVKRPPRCSQALLFTLASAVQLQLCTLQPAVNPAAYFADSSTGPARQCAAQQGLCCNPMHPAHKAACPADSVQACNTAAITQQCFHFTSHRRHSNVQACGS